MQTLLSALLRISEGWALADMAARQVRRVIVQMVLALIAGTMAIGAFGCLITALWLWALVPLGPIGAPLAVAATLLLLCVALLGAMQMLWSRDGRRAAAPVQTANPLHLLNVAAQSFAMGLQGAGRRK
jgi:hypothetical protein